VLQTSSGGTLNVFRLGPGHMLLTVLLFDSMDSVIYNLDLFILLPCIVYEYITFTLVTQDSQYLLLSILAH